MVRVMGFSDGSESKETVCPGSGRSPGKEMTTQLPYSCLESSMDRGAWWVTVHGSHKELDITEQVTLSFFREPYRII